MSGFKIEKDPLALDFQELYRQEKEKLKQKPKWALTQVRIVWRVLHN